MTAQLWLPGFDTSVKGHGSGSFTSATVEKAVAHTTEGPTLAGAIGAFRTNDSWPTIGLDPIHRLRNQFLPLNEAARALRHGAGPQTNRDGVIQFEIVGFAAHPDIWTIDEWLWLGAEGMGPAFDACGIPKECSVVFHPYPPDHGARLGSEPWRLSPAAWDAYRGLLGHQHAYGNTHGDPGDWSSPQAHLGGRSPLSLIFEGMGSSHVPPAPTPPIDTEEQEIMGAKQEILDAIESTKPALVRSSATKAIYVVGANGYYGPVDKTTISFLRTTNQVQHADTVPVVEPDLFDSLPKIPLSGK